MDPLAFLHRTAKKLKNANHEADQRTAASRSYYAIYHHIKNAFEREGIHLKTSHGLLYNYFFQPSLPHDIQAIGKHLQTLYEYRRRADYDLSDPWQKEDSSIAYSMANKLNTTFSIAFTGDTKRSIVEAVKTYLDSRGYIN